MYQGVPSGIRQKAIAMEKIRQAHFFHSFYLFLREESVAYHGNNLCPSGESVPASSPLFFLISDNTLFVWRTYSLGIVKCKKSG